MFTGYFSRKWCNLGCNFSVIIEGGQLTRCYGFCGVIVSLDCSRFAVSFLALKLAAVVLVVAVISFVLPAPLTPRCLLLSLA